MNNINLAGTAFKPELRYTPDQTAVFKFTLSTYTGKDAEGNYKPSVWVRCTAFGDLAEQLNTEITERMRVTVTGSMEPVREWTDKEGKTRFEIAMIARAVVQGNTIDEKVEEVW